MSRRALECSRCGAPVTYLAEFCTYCRSALTFGAVPELGAGEVGEQYDFRSAAPPGFDRVRSGKFLPGVGLEIALEGSLSIGLPLGRAGRDVTAVVRSMALDDHGGVGLRVRTHTVGGSTIGYRLRCRPRYRQFRLERFATNPKWVTSEPLCDWQVADAVAPPGQWNTLELRCADSIFHAYINDVRVGTALDARFGFGECGYEVSSYDKPAVSRVEWFRLGHPSAQ